jgi:antitoxin MazE
VIRVRAKLVQIGNSRGVRLPKPLLQEAGLTDEVEIRARKGAIVIERVGRPRAGWAEAARQLRERSNDRLLDEPVGTRFDDEEWQW